MIIFCNVKSLKNADKSETFNVIFTINSDTPSSGMRNALRKAGNGKCRENVERGILGKTFLPSNTTLYNIGGKEGRRILQLRVKTFSRDVLANSYNLRCEKKYSVIVSIFS